MDSATDGWPSSVHDCSYCCEPNSIFGLPSGVRVTTSRSRTIPVAGDVGPLVPVAPVAVALPVAVASLGVEPAPSVVAWFDDGELVIWLDAALMMISANCAGSVSRPKVLIVN